jgi:Tfp pilus assembly protein PilZ
MGGLFVQTPKPKPVGSKLRFALRIQSDAPPIKGFGEVRWIRVRDQGRGAPAGMGIQVGLLIGEEGENLLRSSIAGAVKASSVSNSPVPAPALPMSWPEAREALARARPQEPVAEAARPVAEDEILRRKREKFQFGQHAERSSDLKLKRMTEKAIKEGKKPKKFILEKDGEDVSMLERFRVKHAISKPGFLLIKTLVVVSLLIWLTEVIFF